MVLDPSTIIYSICYYLVLLGRDLSTGATGTTVVAHKFSDTLTLSPPGGQILPTTAEDAAKWFQTIEYMYLDWLKTTQF